MKKLGIEQLNKVIAGSNPKLLKEGQAGSFETPELGKLMNDAKSERAGRINLPLVRLYLKEIGIVYVLFN